MNLSRNVISYNVPNSSHLSSCKTCVELSNQETKLRQHNLSVHHSCLECNLRFENHWKTARHLQEVHNIQARCPFGCDFLIFAPDIKLHMKYKHNLSDRNNGECVYCQREFTMVNLLHHYIVKHEYCATCGINCFGKDRLNHGEFCVLKCGVCNKVVSSLVELEGHIVEDHLKCIHCDIYSEEFSTKEEIVNHVKTQHLPKIYQEPTNTTEKKKVVIYYNGTQMALNNSPEKAVIEKCQFCPFKAKTNVEMQKHLAIQHKFCNVCCKQFKAINVRIHLMSEHNISIKDDNSKSQVSQLPQASQMCYPNVTSKRTKENVTQVSQMSHQSVTSSKRIQQSVTPKNVTQPIVTSINAKKQSVTPEIVTIVTPQQIQKVAVLPSTEKTPFQIKCDHCNWWADDEEQLNFHTNLNHNEDVIELEDDEPQIESHIKIEPMLQLEPSEPVRKRPKLPKIKCLECDFMADTEKDLNEHYDQNHNAILPD